ncbi:hypothetical protein B0H17DRAFT_1130015 [Mycena rosella]|uniref:Uncharacterized protein n=1 Tax=Mycena rosella TaxID=1033263 RepID=A0AAD7DRJ5_MYCRO|nr:hypothetical protein B0H17DRAFT_1130015 [Mycena rosella]
MQNQSLRGHSSFLVLRQHRGQDPYCMRPHEMWAGNSADSVPPGARADSRGRWVKIEQAHARAVRILEDRRTSLVIAHADNCIPAQCRPLNDSLHVSFVSLKEYKTQAYARAVVTSLRSPPPAPLSLALQSLLNTNSAVPPPIGPQKVDMQYPPAARAPTTLPDQVLHPRFLCS